MDSSGRSAKRKRGRCLGSKGQELLLPNSAPNFASLGWPWFAVGGAGDSIWGSVCHAAGRSSCAGDRADGEGRAKFCRRTPRHNSITAKPCTRRDASRKQSPNMNSRSATIRHWPRLSFISDRLGKIWRTRNCSRARASEASAELDRAMEHYERSLLLDPKKEWQMRNEFGRYPGHQRDSALKHAADTNTACP